MPIVKLNEPNLPGCNFNPGLLPGFTCMGTREMENQMLELCRQMSIWKLGYDILLAIILIPYTSFPQTPLLPMLRSALPDRIPDPQVTDGLPRDFFDVESQGPSGDILDPWLPQLYRLLIVSHIASVIPGVVIQKSTNTEFKKYTSTEFKWSGWSRGSVSFISYWWMEVYCIQSARGWDSETSWPKS